ncbi:hypothetical protein G7046_g9958 [Stylonectria norvegica]|nr:hypothetical protein G7046_g9958 [Stylonectria norvegica]
MDEDFTALGAHGEDLITQVAETSSPPAFQDFTVLGSAPARDEGHSWPDLTQPSAPHQSLSGDSARPDKTPLEIQFPRFAAVSSKPWFQRKDSQLSGKSASDRVQDDLDEVQCVDETIDTSTTAAWASHTSTPIPFLTAGKDTDWLRTLKHERQVREKTSDSDSLAMI